MNGGVEFKEETSFKRWRSPDQKPGFGSKLANLIMKISGGLIKTEQQANYIILGLIGLVIIISLFLIFSGGSEGENYTGTGPFPTPPPASFSQ